MGLRQASRLAPWEQGMGSQHSRATTATGHPNAAIARDLWIATSESDEAGIRRLLAPDVEWRTFTSGSLAGSLRGADAVLDLLARSGEIVDSLTSDLIDIYASDDGAVTHYRVSAHLGPRHLETQAMLVMRIRSGQIVSAFAVPVDAQANDTFWLSH